MRVKQLKSEQIKIKLTLADFLIQFKIKNFYYNHVYFYGTTIYVSFSKISYTVYALQSVRQFYCFLDGP